MGVSLLLPTRNAEWCLPYTLPYMSKLNPPPDEIVICIGKSDDKTEEIILEYVKTCQIPTRIYYDREGIGTGYAMALLTKEAKYDVCLWKDSDGIKPINWIERMSNYFEKNPELSYIRERGTELSADDLPNFTLKEEPYNPRITYDGRGKVITASGLSAFRKSSILKAGNFDPLFTRGQDLDIAIRMFNMDMKGGEAPREGFHFGVYGIRHFVKVLGFGNFIKFFYKYGFEYIQIIPQHFIGVCCRTIFILSGLCIILSSFLPLIFIEISITLFILSLIGLLFGMYVSFRRINPNHIIIQILTGVGEIYHTIKFLLTKGKPPYLYGKKYLKQKHL